MPALQPGARLLIDDQMLPKLLPELLPLSAADRRRKRWSDVNMLVYLGARERTLGDWRELLAMADEGFRIINGANLSEQTLVSFFTVALYTVHVRASPCTNTRHEEDNSIVLGALQRSSCVLQALLTRNTSV